MEPLELTTELEAVNAMLASIGESPVASMDDAFVDAGLARELLAQASRQMQSRGWEWNTDREMTLAPNATGEIIVPASTLRMMPLNGETYVLRGLRVYDRDNRTYIFTTSFTADIVSFLGWEDLPEPARVFAYMRAARRFQDRLGADNEQRRILAADEQGAWSNLQEYEAEVGQYNAIRSDRVIQRMGRYRNRRG